jgi:hypothetical protein
MTTPPDHTAELVIRVSYQSSLGSDRGAVFETYIPQSASIEAIGALMDKLRLVCDRQTAIVKVEELRRAIISDEAQLQALQADMVRIEDHQLQAWVDGGRKGSFVLSKAEAQARNNIEGSIINRTKSIELLKKQLAECEAQIAE